MTFHTFLHLGHPNIPSILVLFAIPMNFPGTAENSREFPIPGNENFVPESLSLIEPQLQDTFDSCHFVL